MIDPLTALALACNIVQFVDFISKLISTTHNLYASTSGAKAEHLELEALANTLHSLADDAAPPSQRINNVSSEKSTFIELDDMCSRVSDELLSVLQNLRVKGLQRGWTSFIQALRSEWKRKEISALQARLDRIGDILNAKTLKNLQIKTYLELKDLNIQNTRLQAARAHNIEVSCIGYPGKVRGNRTGIRENSRTKHDNGVIKAAVSSSTHFCRAANFGPAAL